MSDETPDRIARAALELFAEKGYGATSVAEILARAHVNAGSMYYYFKGKEDVLEAVLQRYLAGIDVMLLKPAWEGIEDPIERVFALLSSYGRALEQTNCRYGCPIGSLALEIKDPADPVRQLLVRNFEAWIEAVEQCFIEAKDVLPSGTDPYKLANFTLVTMEGGVMLSRTRRDTRAFESAVESLRDYIEHLTMELEEYPV